MPRKFQLISDVHLHRRQRADQIIKEGDYLLIAGDLAEWGDASDSIVGEIFINRMCNQYEKVFYIFGNHELYHGDYTKCLDKVRNLKFADNFHFLHGDTYEEDDLVIFGHPLWTNLDNNNPIAVHTARHCMNDFRICANNGRLWTPEDTLREHAVGMAKLEQVCLNNKDKQILVMTHHAPTASSVDHRYRNEGALNFAYYSELNEFILKNENIKFWVHGHMHNFKDYMVGQCRIMANPLGYAHDYSTFVPDFTFEV